MCKCVQMKGGGSAFDGLGMPTIRPRGSKGEEKRAEVAPAVAEVAPVSQQARNGGGVCACLRTRASIYRWCLDGRHCFIIKHQTNSHARCRSSSR